MAPYELAKAADQDFENIFDFGIDTFGLVQAMDYQQGMKIRFEELAEQPQLYQAVDHIRAGYRRSITSRITGGSKWCGWLSNQKELPQEALTKKVLSVPTRE